MEILVGLLISIGLAFWVYYDAAKRDMSSPGWWATLIFLIWFIGLPIYLAKRPSENEAVHQCPHCSKYYEGRATFCPNCGSKMVI